MNPKNIFRRITRLSLVLLIIISTVTGCGDKDSKVSNDKNTANSEENSNGATETANSEENDNDVTEEKNEVLYDADRDMPFETRTTFMVIPETEMQYDGNVIEISTLEELNEARAHEKATIRLMADIDMQGADFQFYHFKGIFDGNCHVIKNCSKPLFQTLYGTIRNLGIVDATCEEAGLVETMDGGVIENCYVTGTIGKDSEEIDTRGGLVAKVDVGGNCTISYCYNAATIYISRSIQTLLHDCGVGGIVGEYRSNAEWSDTCEIRNCENYGNIVSVEENINVGGIVGIIGIADGRFCIQNCINYADISVHEEKENQVKVETGVGGIVGAMECYEEYSDARAINNCFACVNYGDIVEENSSYVGGICGIASTREDSTVTISECINGGKISGNQYRNAGVCCMAEIDGGQVNISRCANLSDVVKPILAWKECEEYGLEVSDCFYLMYKEESKYQDIEYGTGLSADDLQLELYKKTSSWKYSNEVNGGYPYIVIE